MRMSNALGSFRSVIRFKRRRVPEWTDDLNDVISELEQMNRSTEADFLAITHKLTSFLSAARTISGETRAITDCLSGEAGNSVCDAFRAVLEDGRRMERRATGANELMQLRESVTHIRRSLSGFKRVGPSFQVMAILAQIETAQLGSAGLDVGQLADQFRTAGEDIRSRVDSVLNGASVLEKRIESTLREAYEFDKRSLQVLPSLLTMSEGGLNDFRKRQEEGAETACRLARDSDLLAKAIGDIVASLQCHDITRQQVEHVIDSLKQLADGSASDGRLSASAAAVIELQLAQLVHAEKAFLEAVRQMTGRLETIARQVTGMVAESARLLGAPDAQDKGFYSQMERCFRAIADVANGCAGLEHRTRATVVDLEHTIESLQESARQIHSVELRLRWLALNAAISSAHIGPAGEPLEAVAAAMHRLLVECEACSGEADTTISEMAATVRSATESSAGPDSASSDVLFQELRKKIEQLHALNVGAAYRSQEITAIAGRLSDDVEALRAGISAGQVFSSTTARCCGALRRIQSQAGSGAVVDGKTLLQFQEQYTMRSEREIHQAVVAGAAADLTSARVDATPADAAATAVDGGAHCEADTAIMVAGADEFGDNVELF